MSGIEHLVVISGPSRSGKTYLIDQIRADRHSPLRAQLQLSQPDDYECVSALQLQRRDGPMPARILLHYDLCYQWEQDDFAYLEALIDQSHHVTMVTLQAPISVLRRRNLSRLLRQLKLVLRQPLDRNARRHLGYLWRLHRLYGAPPRMQALYEHWQQCMSRHTITRQWWFDPRRQQLQTRPAPHFMVNAS